MIYYFCAFTVVGILNVEPGANVTNAFLLNAALLGFQGYFLPLIYFNFTECVFWVCAHSLMGNQ